MRLTEWLKNDVPSRATSLLEYVYNGNIYGEMTKEKLFDGENRCIVAFFILLEMGWGDLIHLFKKFDKIGQRLPIDLPNVQKGFLNIEKYLAKHEYLPRKVHSPDKLAAEFYEVQWKYCAAKFELEELYDCPKDRIVPIHKKFFKKKR